MEVQVTGTSQGVHIQLEITPHFDVRDTASCKHWERIPGRIPRSTLCRQASRRSQGHIPQATRHIVARCPTRTSSARKPGKMDRVVLQAGWRNKRGQ
jgi:hypothetical protein